MKGKRIKMNNDDKWNNYRREHDQPRKVDIEYEGKRKNDGEGEFDEMHEELGDIRRSHSDDKWLRTNVNSSRERMPEAMYNDHPMLSKSYEKMQRKTQPLTSDSYNGRNYQRMNQNGGNPLNCRKSPLSLQDISSVNFHPRPINNIIKKYPKEKEMKNKNIHPKNTLEEIKEESHNVISDDGRYKYNDIKDSYDYKGYEQAADDDYKRDPSVDNCNYEHRISKEAEEEEYYMNRPRRYNNDTPNYKDKEVQIFNIQDDFIGRRSNGLRENNGALYDAHYNYDNYKMQRHDSHSNYERDSNYEDFQHEKAYNERDAYFESFHQTPHGEVKNTYYNPFAVKHRRRTSKMQLRVLEKTFETNIRPDAALRKILGDQLQMTPRCVQVWFQNRRAKIKKNKKYDDKTSHNLYEQSRYASRPQTSGDYNEKFKRAEMEYLDERVRAHSAMYPEAYIGNNNAYDNAGKGRTGSVVYPEGYAERDCPSVHYNPKGQDSYSRECSLAASNSMREKNDFSNGMYFSPISPQDTVNFYSKIDVDYERQSIEKKKYENNADDAEDFNNKYMNS